jgi:carbonic anhydrase
MESSRRLLLANKAWVKEKLDLREDFFKHLAVEQNPEFLWISCADSRVPPEEVTGADPGELFVHRNIANQVIHTDISMLTVLEYAIVNFSIKHIIVCGHYGCGGVKAAMSGQDFGLVNNWLRHIKEIYKNNREELENNFDEESRFDRQVRHLASNPLIQISWRRKQAPAIHGWVYNMHTGYIKELISITHEDPPVDPIFTFDSDVK